jgi:hypothetical protein
VKNRADPLREFDFLIVSNNPWNEESVIRKGWGLKGFQINSRKESKER